MRFCRDAVHTHGLHAQDIVHLLESCFDNCRCGGAALLDEILQVSQTFGNGIDGTADFAVLHQRSDRNNQIIQAQSRSTGFDTNHSPNRIRNESFSRSHNDQILCFRQYQNVINLLQSRQEKNVVGNRLLTGKRLLYGLFEFNERHVTLLAGMIHIRVQGLLCDRFTTLLFQSPACIRSNRQTDDARCIDLDSTGIAVVIPLIIVPLIVALVVAAIVIHLPA